MSENLSFALEITTVGLGSVFAVLIAITLIITMMKAIDHVWRKRELQKTTISNPAEQNIDTITLTIITAAVTTYLAGRYQIKKIRRIQPLSNAAADSWSSQGRSVLMGSHVIQRK